MAYQSKTQTANVVEPINANKIILRQLTEDDVTDDYVSWMNDPEVYRYLGTRFFVPYTKDKIKEFVAGCPKQKRPHFGIFHDGRHIGNVSCSVFCPYSQWIDISFVIGDKAYWGQGISTQATASVTDYIFKDLGFRRVQGGVLAPNKAAIRVFEKLGFRLEGCYKNTIFLYNEYVDDLKFGILASEWLKNPSPRSAYKVEPLAWSYF